MNSGWWWLVKRVGIRTTWHYWRAGARRGWMTDEQALSALIAAQKEIDAIADETVRVLDEIAKEHPK